MALRIVWSLLAQEKRLEILTYWNHRNRNKAYSIKLNRLFSEAAKQLSEFPHIGRKTDISGVRVKVIGNYLMFYQVVEGTIEILTIWDSRQDPETFQFSE